MTHSDRIVGYNVLSVLGYGANSTIYAVQEPRTEQVYALKRVIRNGPNDQKFVEQAYNEYRTTKNIDHPVIRKCMRIRRRRKLLITSEILLLMELIDGRSLIQQRPDHLMEMIRVFMEVCDGLAAVHRAGFVHADIKPNNILTTEDRMVKVIDFGQSCRIGTVKNRIQGTPDYIAPEQVKRRALTPKTDIFNFGATMYWCLTDNHIPTLIPKTRNEIGLKSDMKLRPPDEFNPELPLALNNLVLHCLQSRPDDRPDSMAEVRARLDVSMRKLDEKQPSRSTRASS